jgi:UDP-glucose 4-epimerase
VPDGAVFVVGDVRDRALVEERVGQADRVFHLAAAVGTRTVAADPAGTWSRNVLGTAAVLDACVPRRTPVLVASSSEVYGPRCSAPLVEDDASALQVTGRREVYALSKAAGEAYALALARSARLPVVVTRLFNVVGPGQSGRYGMVLPRFVRAARRDETLVVYGDGEQRRCFLHVADAVRALVALAETPRARGHAVNVGSRRETRILDLARAVTEEAGGGRIAHVPFDRIYGQGFMDPVRRVPDVTRLETWTGVRPRLDIRHAIRDTLAVGVAT